MKMVGKKYRLLVLLVNIVFFCLMAWLLPIMFEDNDDTTMVWIADGVYSGQPDCHLVFINAIFGQLLVWLYSWIADIEWYVVLFAVLHIISVTVTVSYFLKYISDKWLRICGLTLLYSLWAWIIVRFQFTTTAALTAFAATLLLLDRKYVAGGVMFIFGAMVRFSAAGLVGLIMVPAFLYVYRVDWKKGWLPLSFVLSLTVFVHKADSLFYNTPEWKAFVEFNSARGKINDNPNCWSVYDHLPEGVDQLDYSLLAGFFADPEVITTPQLEIIVDEITHPSIKQCIYNAVFKMAKPNVWWLVLFLLPFVFCLIGENGPVWRNWWMALPYCLWFTVLCCIAFSGAVKHRVFLSSLLPMMFYIMTIPSLLESTKRRNCALCCLLLFISVWGFIIPTVSRSKGLADKKPVIAEQMSLVDKAEGFQIVPSGAELSVQLLPPFELHKVIESRKFINSYCMMKSPLNDTYMTHRDLVTNDLVLFANKPYDTLELSRAIYKNYGLQIDTLHIAETEHYELIKFIKCTDE